MKRSNFYASHRQAKQKHRGSIRGAQVITGEAAMQERRGDQGCYLMIYDPDKQVPHHDSGQRERYTDPHEILK